MSNTEVRIDIAYGNKGGEYNLGGAHRWLLKYQ